MNKEHIIESVINFSEGHDPEAIEAICRATESVEGVRVLHTDRGWAANRTVITSAGTPDAVAEAAFRATAEAARRIDMRRHHGNHPRIGATDVLPLVPVRGISLAECVVLARELARRIGEQLGIPVYCYEAAAFSPQREPLENCRRGEYEGLADKMTDPRWRPDFGPAVYTESVARTGATIVGARSFLGAVNFNLSVSGRPEEEIAVAKEIAAEVRGRSDSPYALPRVKAIGWYVEEFGRAQVSTNLTDLSVTGLYEAFTGISEAARRRGYRVTGTEVIGLLPLWAVEDAARKFSGIPDLTPDEAATVAVRELGLDDLREVGKGFDARQKIIDFLL